MLEYTAFKTYCTAHTLLSLYPFIPALLYGCVHHLTLSELAVYLTWVARTDASAGAPPNRGARIGVHGVFSFMPLFFALDLRIPLYFIYSRDAQHRQEGR